MPGRAASRSRSPSSTSDDLRERLGRGLLRRRRVGARRTGHVIEDPERTGLLPKANTPAGGPVAAGTQAAGDGARAGDEAQAPAAGRDRGRADRCRMPVAHRHDQGEVHAGGVTIIWIEHVTHALTGRGGRSGRSISARSSGIGAPQAIMDSAAVKRDLPGDRGMRLLSTHGLTALLRRFPGALRVDIACRRGRDHRHYRRQRRGQDDAHAVHHRQLRMRRAR
jgi:hypothetical protein